MKSVFQQLIQEARKHLKGHPRKNAKLRELEASRPEVSTARPGLPRRGLEGTKPFGGPPRSTLAYSVHR